MVIALTSSKYRKYVLILFKRNKFTFLYPNLFFTAVYDDATTAAFVKTVSRLLAVPPRRSIYVALEKRYVFLISECDSAAPCYEYFLECLRRCENIKYEEVDTDFPKYFQYERVKELVLWKITSAIY